MSPAAGDDELPPLGLIIGFGAMMFGNFMALLDVQIVASAIAAIQAGVGATRDEITWVQTSYLIAEVIGIPLSGFMARALGTRLLFTLSASAFTLASVLCACAWDLNSLIVFRTLQGFFGAAMIPTTMATMFLLFKPKHQAMAGAFVGMATVLGPSVGPTLGGYIAEAFGWRWLFWINVAPGVLIASLVWRYLHVGAGDLKLLKRLDVLGLIGLALMLGCAEYVLEEGPNSEWFASSDIVMLALLSGLGALIFFYRVSTVETPVVDLRPLQIPTFAIASCLAFIVGMTLFGPLFLQPLFLSSVRGLNALQIGEIMSIQGITMLAMTPFNGFLVRKLKDVRPFGAFGFLLVAWSCWHETHLTAQSGFYEFMPALIARGMGLMICFTSVMQPSIQALPPHLVHAGAALFNTIRNLGGAFGLSWLISIQHHAVALHRQELYSALDPNNPHVSSMLAGMRAHIESTGSLDAERQALMHYAGILDREALVMTFNDLFLMLAVLALFAGCCMFFLKRPQAGAGKQAEAAMLEAH